MSQLPSPHLEKPSCLVVQEGGAHNLCSAALHRRCKSGKLLSRVSLPPQTFRAENKQAECWVLRTDTQYITYYLSLYSHKLNSSSLYFLFNCIALNKSIKCAILWFLFLHFFSEFGKLCYKDHSTGRLFFSFILEF